MNRKVVLKVNFMIHWDAKPDNVRPCQTCQEHHVFQPQTAGRAVAFRRSAAVPDHTALPGMVRPGDCGKTTRALEGQLSISSFQAILKIMHFCMHTLHYITLPYLTLSTLPYLTLHYIALSYLTLHYITLHTLHKCYILRNAIECHVL